VRAQLEAFAAELAATRIGPDDLDELRKTSKTFRKAIERWTSGKVSAEVAGRSWQEANTVYHQIIQRASGNDVLIAAIHDLHRTFPRNLTWAALRDNPRLLATNVTEHDQVLDALERGDAAAARDAMRAHIGETGDLVAAWFERQWFSSTAAGPAANRQAR